MIEAENAQLEKIEEISRLERQSLRPEELGLTTAEVKALLHDMQQIVVTEQIAEYLAQYKTYQFHTTSVRITLNGRGGGCQN